MKLRFRARGNFRLLRGQDKLTLELAAIFLDVLFFLDRRPDSLRRDHAVCAWCPRLGVSDQGKGPWRNRLQRESLVGPALAEGPPRLEVHVGELPFFHLTHG